MGNVATAALVVLVVEGALGLAAAGIFTLRGPLKNDVPYNCWATASTFECSFTNAGPAALLGVCVGGRLVPKGGGEAVESQLLCSGTIGPRETRTLTTRLQGRVVEACHDGRGTLDFDACSLVVAIVP